MFRDQFPPEQVSASYLPEAYRIFTLLIASSNYQFISYGKPTELKFRVYYLE